MAIARNIVAHNVPLDDLAGITILAGQDYDLSIEPAEAVANSQDLITAINADEIVLLNADGTAMTKTESLGAATQTDNDRFVAITASDTTPDYLNNKLAAGTGIGFSTLNPGADEQIELNVNLALGDHTDITITGPIVDGEILQFDNGTSQWINQTPAEAGLVTTTDLSAHTGDATIHFTEASISHLNIADIGTNSHADIDTHIADSTIHYTKASILINDLGDIVITTPADNELLAYDTTSGDWINQTPAEVGVSEVGHTHELVDINTLQVTGATVTNLRDSHGARNSSGVVEGGIATFTGGGNVTVTAGDGFVRLADVHTDPIYTISWPETVLSGFPVNQDSFIYAYVNAGVPTLAHTTIPPFGDDHDQTKILLAAVYPDSVSGNYFINNEISTYINDSVGHTISRFRMTEPFGHVSGAIVSETGTRNLAITSGEFWEGLNYFTTPAMDTSATDTFTTMYQDGVGGWSLVPAQTTFSNTQYDDGDGILGNLTVGNYGIHWIFMDTNGNLFMQYGGGDYATLTEAQDSGTPMAQHPAVQYHARLIGKIIIQQGATNATSVESAFRTEFSTALPTDHNNLINNGTNTHTQIDSHIASNANPHSTTLANLDDTTITSPLNEQFIRYDDGTGKWINETVPRLVQISATDTTPGYLGTEIVAGAGIQLNILNPGVDEKLEIQNLASAPNLWLTFNGDTGTTSANTTTDALTVSGAGAISTSITGDTLTITGTDENVKVSLNDTTPGYLNGKLVAGTGITFTENNDGLDETLTISHQADLHSLPGLTDVDSALTPAAGHMLYYDAITDNQWESAQFFVPGQKQTIQTTFGTIPSLSGTTDNPISATAPLITDGTQVWSATITPTAADSEIKVSMSFAFTISNAAQQVVATLFRDTTPIGAMVDSAANSNDYQTVSFTIKDPGPFVAGVPVTYSMRFGRAGGNVTWYINTDNSANTFGGTLSNNAYTIEEVVIL